MQLGPPVIFLKKTHAWHASTSYQYQEIVRESGVQILWIENIKKIFLMHHQLIALWKNSFFNT